MPRVTFARAFRRHVECPDAVLDGTTVRELLDAYFAHHAGVRSYVLDELGATRKHIAIFVNNDQIRDRGGLTDTLVDSDILYVFQALSGG